MKPHEIIKRIWQLHNIMDSANCQGKYHLAMRCSKYIVAYQRKLPNIPLPAYAMIDSVN